MNKQYFVLHFVLLAACLLLTVPAAALDHPGLAERNTAPGRFSLVEKGVPAAVVTDPADKRGVLIAAETLREDFARVCGVKAPAQGARVLYAGTKDSPLIKRLAAEVFRLNRIVRIIKKLIDLVGLVVFANVSSL